MRWGTLAWATGMLVGCATGGVGPGRFVPVADHHQHLFSPDIVALLGGASGVSQLGADDLIPLLDSAGIRRAVVLSVAYMYGSPSRTVENEFAKVRAENDWAAAQAARYPDRLIAFCGFNPLKDYALEELARCAGDRRFGRGIKLHFGNSDVQLDEPAHLERLRRVFRTANEQGMAIVVHLRASISRKRPTARRRPGSSWSNCCRSRPTSRSRSPTSREPAPATTTRPRTAPWPCWPTRWPVGIGTPDGSSSTSPA